MDCIANPPRKSRFSILAIAFFITLFALQPGYSEENAASALPAIETGTAPRPVTGTYRPFSKIAVGVTIGTFGPGLELATPLSRRTNLRVDGSFFNYDLALSQNGVNYNGNLNLREIRASYDFFPFHGGFRLSGGVAVYNHFNVAANATVPAGSTVTLNDVDYYSSATDPLHGNASLVFGRKVAPTFTFGWGNVIPRSGRHLAFPVEIGAAYTGTPTFALNMAGTACVESSTTGCAPASTDPGFQSNLTAERNKVKNDLQPLRVYPILNAGVSYRF